MKMVYQPFKAKQISDFKNSSKDKTPCCTINNGSMNISVKYHFLFYCMEYKKRTGTLASPPLLYR